ncbi:MAG: hypothetical protein U5L72_01325 [Bacteroidales bacterium]|nr:hypothetical protein [Bacteroidales bacterium]
MLSKSSFKTKTHSIFDGYTGELAATILKEAERLNVELTGVGIGAPECKLLYRKH